MKRWQRTLLGLVLAGAVIFGLIFATLPGLIEKHAVRYVKETYDRSLVIKRITLNPLTWTLTVEGLSMTEAHKDDIFVTLDRLAASLSSSSIWRLAPILDQVRVENPSVQIVRLGENRFNFSDLAGSEKKEKAADSQPGSPFLFSLNNIEILNGSVEFLDNSLPGPESHRADQINLAIPFFGNLPYLADRYIQPAFSAVIDGAPVELDGKLKVFTDVAEATLGLQLRDLDVTRYLAYLPTDLPVQVTGGELFTDLVLVFRTGPQAGPVLQLQGDIALTRLEIQDHAGSQILFLPYFKASLLPSRITEKHLDVDSLRIFNPRLTLVQTPQGTWNLLPAAASSAGKEPGPEPGAAAPLLLTVHAIRLRDGMVDFSDQLPAGGFSTVIRDLNFETDELSTAPLNRADLRLNLKTDRGEVLDISGQLSLGPLSVTLDLKGAGIPLAAYHPYYQQFGPIPAEGLVNFDGRIHSGPEAALLVENFNLTAKDFKRPFDRRDGVSVASLEFHGVDFDLDRNRLEMDSYLLKGGRLSLSRDKTGYWSFMSIRVPFTEKLAKTAAEAEAEAAPENTGPPFSFHLARFEGTDWQVRLRDELPERPAKIEWRDVNFLFENLAAPDNVKSPFKLSLLWTPKGRIEADGNVVIAAPAGDFRTQVRRLPLPQLAPYLPPGIGIELVDGRFDAETKTSLRKEKDGMTASFSGHFGIEKFHALDALHKEDLLKWERLQIEKVKGSTGTTTKLDIGSIVLSNYFAKVLIDEEGTLNLIEAFSPGDAEAEGESASTEGNAENTEEPAKSAVTPNETPEASQALHPDIQIGSVVLQGGEVDFSDLHLIRPFTTRMLALGGRVSGLSSTAKEPAEVDLRGQLRNQSPLTVTGTVAPLAEDLTLDLKLSFRSIDLAPFTPYAGTFLGYVIDKGKLTLDLDYHIAKKQLTADNKVFLDQFTLGGPVKSDQATGLPVKLAIALLKDRNGEIHLNIPVSGKTDDPQFSIAGVVFKIIGNLLVKAATSPLSLLASLFGSEEDFSTVTFPYGSAQLTLEEQEKLKQMSQALLDRPSLLLGIRGETDPEFDPEGYRRVQLAQAMRRAKFLDEMKQKDRPADLAEEKIEILPEEYDKYLKKVYREADFPRPKNFIGMLKDIPPAEMEKLIYANTPVGPEQLQVLADSRAQAVQSFLAETGGIPPDRLFLALSEGEEKPKEKKEDAEPGNRVTFDVQVK